MQDEYEAHLVRMTTDEYWEAVVASGWLSDVAPSGHAELERRVREAFEQDPLHAWTALAVTAFDGECIYSVDPDASSYAARLTLIAEATQGMFRPTSIRNEYVNQQIRISFVHDGRTYTYDADANSDFFDPEVIELINRALKESGLPQWLFALPATDQVYHLAFVRAETYRRAERLKIVPPPAYFLYRRNRPPERVNTYLDEYYSRLE